MSMKTYMVETLAISCMLELIRIESKQGYPTSNNELEELEFEKLFDPFGSKLSTYDVPFSAAKKLFLNSNKPPNVVSLLKCLDFYEFPMSDFFKILEEVSKEMILRGHNDDWIAGHIMGSHKTGIESLIDKVYTAFSYCFAVIVRKYNMKVEVTDVPEKVKASRRHSEDLLRQQPVVEKH